MFLSNLPSLTTYKGRGGDRSSGGHYKESISSIHNLMRRMELRFVRFYEPHVDPRFNNPMSLIHFPGNVPPPPHLQSILLV